MFIYCDHYHYIKYLTFVSYMICLFSLEGDKIIKSVKLLMPFWLLMLMLAKVYVKNNKKRISATHKLLQCTIGRNSFYLQNKFIYWFYTYVYIWTVLIIVKIKSVYNWHVGMDMKLVTLNKNIKKKINLMLKMILMY